MFKILILLALLFNSHTAHAADWFWLNSNSKYSKYFNPDSVTVVKKAGNIATEIKAEIKTTFTNQGAAETLKNYQISNIKPSNLAYSVATISVFPQTRTIQYNHEDFFDNSDTVIWSKSGGRIKEINSQAFDEIFYAAICDEVFHFGEMDKISSPERWINLFTFTDNNLTSTCTADSSTFQLKGSNLIAWTWLESKSDNKVSYIRFSKIAVNLIQGTVRTVAADEWTASSRRWQPFDDDFGGAYHLIKSDDPEYNALVRLRAFAKANQDWLKRYSIS